MAGLVALLLLLVALVILWVIVSIPVYLAARVVTSSRANKATFGEAMVATLGGAIVYAIVLVLGSVVLGAVLGGLGVVLAFILAVLAWLGVYKSEFQTSWLGALGIAILAAVVLFVLDVILVVLFGFALPSFFHPF